jgi:hypothetical protein
MANHSVLEKLINYHTESLEEQTHYFGMMNALTEIALSGTFLDQPKLILHHYLCAMSEILDKVSGINEASLALLRQHIESKEQAIEPN